MIFEDAPTLRRGAQYLLFLTSFRNPQSFTLGDSWKDWEMPRRCVGAPNTFCSLLRFGIPNPSHSETHGRIGRCPDVASGRPIPFVPHFVSESSILHTRRLMEGLGDAPTLRRGAQYLLFLTSFRNPKSFTLGDSWKDWEMPRRCVGAPNTFCSSLRFGILNPSHSETHGRIGRCPDVASGRPIRFVPYFVSESSILHTRRLMEGLGDAPTLRRGAQYLLFLTSFRNPQSFTLGDSWKDWEMPRRCVGAPNTLCSSLRFGILNPFHSGTHG